eukprot:5577045-Amphidinium_carterae.2
MLARCPWTTGQSNSAPSAHAPVLGGHTSNLHTEKEREKPTSMIMSLMTLQARLSLAIPATNCNSATNTFHFKPFPKPK